MCQLTKRVVLIHELRQLGRSEEFLNCCCYRFDIDQGLRRNRLCILCCHTLTYNSFQSGQTDTILVLKKFSNRTDTTVTQMVDIIVKSDSVFQMHIVVDRSKNIFFCNMLRNQIMNISLNGSLDIFKVVILFQNLFENRVIY